VVGSALEFADRLMANDQDDAQAPKLRQNQYTANIARGRPFVNALKQHRSAKHAIHIDKVTIAFAAAYLDFYLASPTLGLNTIIQPMHYPRLLVQIAVEHSIKSRSDRGLLRLRPYDIAGTFLTQFVRVKITEDVKHRNKWNVGGIAISRNHLQVLKGMSDIASAAMVVLYRTGARLDEAGLLDASQRLRGDDHFLAYYCAADPLFNRHYMEGIALAYGNNRRPPLSRAGTHPYIPRAVYDDLALAIHVNAALQQIRVICFDAWRPGNDAIDIVHDNNQTVVLCYHSALFIAMVSDLASCCEESLGYVANPNSAMVTAKAHTLSLIATGLKFDTTPGNAKHDAAFLRARHSIFAR
jgi:hypothetical protein